MQFTPLEYAFLGLFIFCFLIQLWYVLFVHLKLFNYKIPELDRVELKPLSIVICARNEIQNLQNFLPSILAQNYPSYEVVVVNDRSWDGTYEYLESIESRYSNLKIVTIADGDKFIAGKKFAVSMGIKAAKYEWLVFTDADCEPASENWLLGMQMPVNDDTELVLGYSPYIKAGGILNALIRFETFFTAVNYLSFALKGMPYMGVGRNLAYKKSLFFKSKGFAAHMHIPSGDDDLFVNANANAKNTAICIHPETHMWSLPNTTWMGYLRQKKRHFGAGKFYKSKHKFILSLQIVAQFLFYTLFIALCFFKETLYPALGVFLFSLTIRSIIYPKLLKRLSYRKLSWWFPILDVLLFVFLVFNFFVSVFVKKVKWR